MSASATGPGSHAGSGSDAPRPGWRGWLIPGAFALVGAWVCGSALREGGDDIAEGATVIVSSRDPNGPEPSALVDGDFEREGVRTLEEERPEVTIDLGRPRDFDAVVVHQRSQSPETVGPLAVEISLDGEAWGKYGDRVGLFEAWQIDAEARARYVKIGRRTPGRLRLTEVEVIGP
jgi:hypothetical protein